MRWPDPINQFRYPHLHKPMKNKRNIIYPLNFAGAHGMVSPDARSVSRQYINGLAGT
jgi:hypothetical protein